jgi:paraquat-inducible protein B
MTDRREALLGFFVVLGLGGIVACTLLFGRFHVLETEREVEVVFEDSISGLAVGAPVTFRGVRIGTVVGLQIEYDPGNRRAYVPVRLRLHHSKIVYVGQASQEPLPFPELVQRGLRAELSSTSLVTGESEIALDFDPGAPAKLHPAIATFPEIPVVISPQARLLGQIENLPLQDLAKRSEAVLANLETMSATAASEAGPLLREAKSTIGDLHRTIGEVRDTVASLHAELGVTLTNADRVLVAASGQLSQRGQDLHGLLVTATAAFSHAQTLLSQVQDMTQRGGPARADLESALNDAADAAAALKGFAQDVERNPQLLLVGRAH